MKYNRKEIMAAAWGKYRRCCCISFAEALRLAWVDAKAANRRYTVTGYRIYNDTVTVLCTDCTWDEAGETEWRQKYAYDHIDIKAA